MSETKYKTIQYNWRKAFSQAALDGGEKDEKNGKFLSFETDPEGRWAKGVTAGGFTVFAYQMPLTYSECQDSNNWSFNDKVYDKEEYADHWAKYDCTCSMGRKGEPCRHLASLMFRFEKVRGPFVFTQTKEEYQEEIRRKKEEEEERKRQEEKSLKESRRIKSLDILEKKFPLPRLTDEIRFRPDQMLETLETNAYEAECFDQMPEKDRQPAIRMETDFDKDTGHQVLRVSTAEETAEGRVRMVLESGSILSLKCSCGRCHYNEYRGYTRLMNTLCCHSLAAFGVLWDRVAAENPGDATDRKGLRFLEVMAEGSPAVPDAAPAIQKSPIVVLTPRITSVKGELQLAFSVGIRGERDYALRGLEKFYNAVEREDIFEASKKTAIDFKHLTFTPLSMKWYDFMATRVRNIFKINRKLESGSSWYTSVKQLSVGSGVPLDGSDLDIVYSLAEGSELLYRMEPDSTGRSRRAAKDEGNEEVYVKAGPARLGIRITLDPERTKDGKLTAIRLGIVLPRLLRGSQYRYILDREQFGRISPEEMRVLKPFLDMAGNASEFTCTIGSRRFPEFYYRTLPALEESVHVEIDDRVGDPGEGVLPPEPVFTFYLDREDETVTCRAVVSYGEKKEDLFPSAGTLRGGMRDFDQEERVLKAVRAFFPDSDSKSCTFRGPSDTDSLVRILTEGISVLSGLGTVKGSDAFRAMRVRPMPRPVFGVSLESGLLNLSLRTKDMTEEELLELLSSYRKKKRWHRLSSGDFIDLRDTEAFSEMENLSSALDLSLEDLVRGRGSMPQYRALYLDRILEEHDEIASSRDRHFKSLIRSFKSVRDADFEVPSAMEDTLRPYQVQGFAWLSTLAQAGFGGILADEMGLGKTLQMLAFLNSQYLSGEKAPALVVCPASLVYNWLEECRKFAPDLPAAAMAGGLAARKKMAAQMGKEEGAWLYITSYDLFKRDIALYEGIRFSTAVLDEAQYVKNRSAAVSKAVRGIHAAHRFALTGTPIENRLSELWSIFDFLMPGFLYTASEFSERFEVPVMKKQDEAASQRLSAMVSPFILRRRKGDVLRDLPEKLEEVRSAALEGEQRKLYDAQVVSMREMLSSIGTSGEEKLRILAQITRLRQICCDPALVFENYKGPSAKREACMDLIRSAIDGGHRMLLFSQFTSMMELLASDLKNEGIPFYTLTGATPSQERLRLVNAFNNGDTPVFLISLRAGGTGLNLTGADLVIHYDPWWNLAVQNQATDRAHRIGQTRQVTEIRLIAAHSIEERIIELQEAKRELADAVLGAEGTSLMSMSAEDLMALLS